MRRLSLRFMAVLLAGLALAACHKDKQAKLVDAGSTPEVAVETALDDVRHGHFDDLYQHLLPPAEYQSLRDSWTQRRDAGKSDVTDKERKQYADLMRDWTGHGAKGKQFARLKPTLDRWETEGKRQLPMLVGVMRMMAGSRITESKALDPDQKQQLRNLVDAVAGWVGDTDWGDEEHARKAVSVLVDSARALDIPTLQDAYALDYDGAMARYATAWKGLRQLLDIYGLSLNAALDSAKVRVRDQHDDKATVEIAWTVLDQPMKSTVEMVRKGKRWYAANALDWWHKQQQKLAQAGSSAPASSSAVVPEYGAPAGSTASAASAPPVAASAATGGQ